MGALTGDGSTLFISIEQEQSSPFLRDSIYKFDVGSLTVTAGPTLTGWTTLALEIAPDSSILVAATLGSATGDDVGTPTTSGNLWKINPTTLALTSVFNPKGSDWFPRGVGILHDGSQVFAAERDAVYVIDSSTWTLSVTEPSFAPEAGAATGRFSGKIAITADDSTAWFSMYAQGPSDAGEYSHYAVPYDVAGNTWGTAILIVDGTVNSNDQQATIGGSVDILLSEDESSLLVVTSTEEELRAFDIGSGLHVGSFALTGSNIGPWRGHGLQALDDDHLFVLINFEVVPISKCFVPKIIRRVF